MKPKVSHFLVFFGTGILLYVVEVLYVSFFVILYLVVKEAVRTAAKKEKVIATDSAERDIAIAERDIAIAERDVLAAKLKGKKLCIGF